LRAAVRMGRGGSSGAVPLRSGATLSAKLCVSDRKSESISVRKDELTTERIVQARYKPRLKRGIAGPDRQQLGRIDDAGNRHLREVDGGDAGSVNVRRQHAEAFRV